MSNTRIRILFSLVTTAVLILCSSVFHFDAEADGKSYSSLVYPGSGGRLVYVPDERGNTIPDYSYAGYAGGGVKLPRVPVRATVEPGGGNDAARIQEALDMVSALPTDKNGFRGAVLLKKGRYELDKPIRITQGGVVLRGEGQGDTGTVLFGKGAITDSEYGDKFRNATLIVIEGESGRIEMPDTKRAVTDDYVPFGARSFHVADTRPFHVGDTVIVRRFTNRAWFDTLGIDMDSDVWKNEPKTFDFDRIITGIEGNLVTVDVPLTCPIEAAWGGGELVRYSSPGRISHVGVENLQGMSDFDRTVRSREYGNMDRSPYIGDEYYSDENHYFNFISIDNAENAWVRNVTALHFASACVYIKEGSKWVTVQDCITREPVSVCAGGRRFTYHISGQQCLVQRCQSDKGRHSFVQGGKMTCGPNVFLDCTATIPYSSSEPHERQISGALYDNVHAPIALRYAKSNPPRWMSIYSLLWNCEGMYIVQKPPACQNYAIGHIGIHAMVFNKNLIDYSYENGFIESWDRHVEPRSLYLKQLEERLGKQAVKNIGAE